MKQTIQKQKLTEETNKQKKQKHNMNTNDASVINIGNRKKVCRCFCCNLLISLLKLETVSGRSTL